MRRLGLAFCLALVLPAVAQDPAGVDQPAAEELQRELFGVHLYGEVGGNERWNECIEPDGDTRYQIGDRDVRGRAWIPADGAICFNYGGPNHCFSVHRNGEGYAFRGGGLTYRTTEIRKGIVFCLSSELIG